MRRISAPSDLPRAADQPRRPAYTGTHQYEVVPYYTSPPKFGVKCRARGCGWIPLKTFNTRDDADQAGLDHQNEKLEQNERRRATAS